MNTNNEKWLKENSRYLRIRVVEQEIGCPMNTIQKWLNGERSLNDKWGNVLDEFINRLLCSEEIVMAPVIKEVQERIQKEEREDSDPLLAVKRMVVENRPKLKSESELKPNKSPGDISCVVNNVDSINDLIKKVVINKELSKVIEWKFNGLDVMDKVEPYIFTNGVKFTVMKYFASIKKYAITDSLEEAREILKSIK